MVLSVGNIANNLAAESAASVAYADDYHSLRGNTAWAAIADVQNKEQLLRKGGDYLRVIYAGYWSDDTLSNAAAPPAMQMANAELALIAKDGSLISNQTRGKKRIKVGPLEIEYDGDAATQKEFVFAAKLIIPLLSNPVDTTGGAYSAKVIRC